ncbi:MAG TPA: DUF11 domain-containing protein [Candidatus Binatia bacterium]|nr:DUF11 domain-containing protein [Candidatus Binatia bacterium]
MTGNATRCPRAARRARRYGLAAAVAALLLAPASPSTVLAQDPPPDSKDRDGPLDVDLDDRIDPVRPGQEIVYEIEIENFTASVAPGVVLTDTLPPGTTFVIAHREPDWAEVPATVVGDQVRIDLGGVDPCDRPGVPRCRDVWLVARVNDDVPPGTRVQNRVDLASSDAATYPPLSADVYTAVGSAAIREADIRAGRPRTDRVRATADLARTGWRTRIDPAPPSVDVSDGIRVRAEAAGGLVLFDVSFSAAELRCTNPSGDPFRTRTCRPASRVALALARIQLLEVTLRPTGATQRNNARLRVRAAHLDVPLAAASELTLTLFAGGETYTDTVPLALGGDGHTARYSRSQGSP